MPHPMQHQFWGSLEEERKWLAVEHCMEKAVPRLALKDVWTRDEGCLEHRDAKPLIRIGSRGLIPSLCS